MVESPIPPDRNRHQADLRAVLDMRDGVGVCGKVIRHVFSLSAFVPPVFLLVAYLDALPVPCVDVS